MKIGKVKVGKTISLYEDQGFSIVSIWRDEYVIMDNQEFDCVRVYFDGKVWKTDENGRYQDAEIA